MLINLPTTKLINKNRTTPGIRVDSPGYVIAFKNDENKKKTLS